MIHRKDIKGDRKRPGCCCGRTFSLAWSRKEGSELWIDYVDLIMNRAVVRSMYEERRCQISIRNVLKISLEGFSPWNAQIVQGGLGADGPLCYRLECCGV